MLGRAKNEYTEEGLMRYLEKHKETYGVNYKYMAGFKEELQLHGLANDRVKKHLCVVKHLLLIVDRKDLKEINDIDIRKIVIEVKGRDYADWTKHDYTVSLKKLGKWINEKFNRSLDLTVCKHKVKHRNKMPEEILTQEEVKRFLQATQNPRDNAVFYFLYESGARIGEVVNMNVKDVQFDKHGCVAILDGKTGRRRVRVVSCASTLTNYLDNHPFRNEPEAPLWVTQYGKRLGYATVLKVIKDVKKRTGIKKRIHPHLFRHSRATHLAQHLTESQLKVYLGWTQGSKMASIYVHLNGSDLDDALLSKVYGLKEQEEVKETIRPLECPRCKEINSTVQQFCGRCGLPLKEECLVKEVEKREAIDSLLLPFLSLLVKRDPEIKNLFEGLAKERGVDSLF